MVGSALHHIDSCPKLPINLFIRTIPFLLSFYQGITLTVHGGSASPYRITKLPFYQNNLPLTAILLNKYFPQKQKRKASQSSPARLNAKAPSMPILPRKLAPFNAILIITLGVYQTPLQHTQMAQKGIHGCD